MEALLGLAVAGRRPCAEPGSAARTGSASPTRIRPPMKRAVRTRRTRSSTSPSRAASGRSRPTCSSRSRAGGFGIRHNNLFIGLGIALALLAIGIGAIHWSKAVMSDHEFVEPRHATRGRDATREGAVEVFRAGERGVRLRPPHRHPRDRSSPRCVARSCRASRSSAVCAPESSPRTRSPETRSRSLSHTMWKKGERLAHDPSGRPIRAAAT